MRMCSMKWIISNDLSKVRLSEQMALYEIHAISATNQCVVSKMTMQKTNTDFFVEIVSITKQAMSPSR